MIKIRYLDCNMPKLEKVKDGDWIDLRTLEDVSILKGEFKLISLGIAMELPKNMEAYVVPRSSTFKNFGILQVNSFGVIDESYNGNNDIWFFGALATRDTVIPKYSRICQFRTMVKMEPVTFTEVERLDNTDRNGHGSTGIA